MVTYLIRFASNEVSWFWPEGLMEEFDFDHHEPNDDGTFAEVYIAEVDGDKASWFERVLEDHPNLISYERQ